ncbi:MAG: thermonuclease family protein [Methyloceanibacter sp.]|uniref:thermonuclease family protein n=1 Tax=Methyloceanibacter sp. TaxID=1965321 RepID=UPI003D6C7E02
MRSTHRYLWICLLGGVLAAVPRALACELPEFESATVASVEDGQTLILTDGRKVRLIGVKAPSPPLGWRGEDPWPFVEEAREALARLASGAAVELRFDARRDDRHGHLLAQVFVVRGDARQWVQEALVAGGFARVYSFADARACAEELLDSEAKARAARTGIWGSWAYRVQDATDVERLGRLTQTYQLVEGTVHAVGQGRQWIYLNFAPDWRRDFTVSVDRKDADLFEAAGVDLHALAGKRIRARGWVQWRNGPMIEATHPEQIEVLTPTPPGL